MLQDFYPASVQDEINFVNPVNLLHPLMEGCVSRLKVISLDKLRLRDLIGSNHGTLATGAFLNNKQSRPGGFGAMDGTAFSGVTPCSHPRPAMTLCSQFTMFQWVWFPASAVGGIWGKWDNGTATLQQFARWNSGLQWFLTNASTNQNVTVASGSVSQPGWNFIVATADGTNMTLYVINAYGTLAKATAALAGPYLPSDTAPWDIGYGRSNGSSSIHDDICYKTKYFTADNVREMWGLSQRQRDPTLNWIPYTLGVVPAAAGATIAALRGLSFSPSQSTSRLTALGTLRGRSEDTSFDTGRVTSSAALRARSDGVSSDAGRITALAALRARSDSAANDTGRISGTAAIRARSEAAANDAGRVTGLGTLRARSNSAGADLGRVTGLAALRARSESAALDTGRLNGVAALRAASFSVAFDSGRVTGKGSLAGASRDYCFASGRFTGAIQMRGLSISTSRDAGEMQGIFFVGGELLGNITVRESLMGTISLVGCNLGTAKINSTLSGTVSTG